jgi:FKBP-type peptidyl-prolyl cis-trans isomerase FkpA
MIKNNISKISVFVTLVAALVLVSCDPGKKFEKEEEALIQQYLTNNSTLNFEKKASGLYYLELQTGPGRLAVKHDTAYVKYTGKFLNGTIFDTNVGKPDTLKFPVNEGWMIKGFDEGLTYMRQGGKASLLVPSKLAYGTTGYYIIEGYTPLLFEIELVKVAAGPGK